MRGDGNEAVRMFREATPMTPPGTDVVECPFCGEPTKPNRLADGSLVCSCAAHRELSERAVRGLRLIDGGKEGS